MPTQAELTPAQLAALDLIIAQKQEAGANADLSFIGGITNILTKVVPVVVKVTPVVTPTIIGAAAAAEKTPQAADAASALDQLDKLSLEQLMEVRKNAQAK